MPGTTSALFCVSFKSIFIHIIQPTSNKYKLADFTLYSEPGVILSNSFISFAYFDSHEPREIRGGCLCALGESQTTWGQGWIFWCSIMSALKTLRLVSISNVSSSDEVTQPDIGLRGPLPTFSSVTSPAPLFPSAGSLRLPCKVLWKFLLLCFFIWFSFSSMLFFNSMDSHISSYFPVNYHSLYFSFKEFYSNACIIIFDPLYSVRDFFFCFCSIHIYNK